MNMKEKYYQYWQTASKQDIETAEILFKNKRYHHCLFFCHLSVEKYLKAVYVYKKESAPPFVHDLVRLAEKTGIKMNDEKRNVFAEISAFNIEARYDDYKLSFYKKATKAFASQYLNQTKGILKWLNQLS